jgi:GT2 family glycosyltransferase
MPEGVPVLTWLGWDGRVLRWRWQHGQNAQVEMCIDGIAFERLHAGESEQTRELPVSPSGNAQIEFSMRDVAGQAIGAPWRVVHGRAASSVADQWQGPSPPSELQELLADAPLPLLHWRMPRVAVVVPIFNSAQLAQRCIQAISRWSSGVHLILIDDASTDGAVGGLLANYAGMANVTVLRNAQNLGYTRSCNRGIELAHGADVVLLNSDTEVGPRWLQRLAQTAHAHESIGSATAVSDNAGAFSVPELEQYCPIPSCWTLVQAQRALLQHAGGCVPELPTGNGFCMYIKRALFDRVGVLDADAFPAGYGEENDLCQRAGRAGFRHVIAGDVLVRHARSASFGAQRRVALGAQGMAILRERYPDYEAQVGATLFSFARRVLDYRVRRLYAQSPQLPAPSPRIVTVSAVPRYECFVPEGDVQDIGALRSWLVRHAIEAVYAADPRDISAALRGAADSALVPIANSAHELAAVAPVDGVP